MSSGVVDVGIRRGDHGLVFTSMKVVLDAEDSVPFAEYGNAAAAASSYRCRARDTFGGGVAVITGAGAGIGAGLARHARALA